MKHTKVLSFIYLIRKTFGTYSEGKGGCYKFYLILKEVFPDAVGYYNGDHVITKINGKFYDIDGNVTGDISGNYLQIGQRDYPEEFMRQTFKEYL